MVRVVVNAQVLRVVSVFKQISGSRRPVDPTLTCPSLMTVESPETTSSQRQIVERWLGNGPRLNTIRHVRTGRGRRFRTSGLGAMSAPAPVLAGRSTGQGREEPCCLRLSTWLGVLSVRAARSLTTSLLQQPAQRAADSRSEI